MHFCEVIGRYFAGVPVRDGSSQKTASAALQIGLETLMMSRQGFPICGPMQELLKQTAITHNVRQPDNIQELMASHRQSKAEYKTDDFIDACTRPTYVQPASSIHAKYSPTFASDWALEARKYDSQMFEGPGIVRSSEEERGAQNLMQIRNLLNMN